MWRTLQLDDPVTQSPSDMADWQRASNMVQAAYVRSLTRRDRGMSFEQVRHMRLYEDIVTQIRERIAKGEFKPGDKLPPEREIAEKLGVSRASLREALRVLEVDGLVISRPGGGRFVRAADPKMLFSANGVISALERSAIRDLLEAREAIECQIASLAAKRATSEEVAELRRILISIKARMEEGEALLDLDTVFHRTLALASHNFVFVNWVTLSLEMLQDTRRKTLRTMERRERLLDELAKITDAIEAHDARTAEEAMRLHIDAVRSGLDCLRD